MSIVANLDLNVRGDVKGLVAPLEQGEKKVKDFGKSVSQSSKSGTDGMSSMASSAMSAAGPIGIAVAAFAGISLTIKGVIDSISGAITAMDGLAVTSKKLGIGTQELAGLQRAGTMAGVGLEATNSALSGFAKNMNEAGMGTGPSILALQQLGLRGKELASLGVSDQLKTVADAISQVGNAGDKIRLTSALGLDALAPALEGGSAGIERMLKESKELGEGDPGAVRAAQLATKAWRDLQASLSAVWNSIASAIGPTLADIGKQLAGVGRSVGKFFNENKDLFSTLFDTLVSVVKVGAEVAAAIWKWSSPLGLFVTYLESTGTTWESFKNGALTALFAIQFAVENWKSVWDLAVSYVTLKVVSFTNDIVHAFTNVLPKAFEILTRAMERIKNGDFKGAFAGIGDDIADAMKRPKTELEKVLEERFKAKGADLAAFIADKMRGLNQKISDPVNKRGDPIQGVARKVAAMEFGSKEAFSTLYGTEDAQKKALNVANDQLQVQRQTLAELRNKKAIRVKRVRL